LVSDSVVVLASTNWVVGASSRCEPITFLLISYISLLIEQMLQSKQMVIAIIKLALQIEKKERNFKINFS
jgi:hypothetical protein